MAAKPKKQKTYSEKLLDRRWQKRKSEIQIRDNWECQINPSHKGALHVHHKYYSRGADPWDYPDEALILLCEKCHWEHERLLDEIKEFAGMGGKAFMEEVLVIMKEIAPKYGWVKDEPPPPPVILDAPIDLTESQRAFAALREQMSGFSGEPPLTGFAALRAQMGR